MKKNRIFLPLAAVAFAAVAGCAAGVRYDDGYGYSAYDAAVMPPPLNAPPELIVLPGTDIYAAPTLSAELYFADGWWWRPWNGHWYRSRHYGRGWASVSTPYFYGSIPLGWRDDYRHHRWHGRPWSYHHVSRDEAVRNWDRWKQDRYWRDDRWATSRDKYRRDGRSSETRRYDQRSDDRRQEDHRDAYTPGDRYERDRNSGDSRREVQREASSPDGRYDSRSRYDDGRDSGRTVRPVERDTRDSREVRPTSRGRVEEQRTAPAVRSAPAVRPAPAVRSSPAVRPAPAVRSAPAGRPAPAVRSTRPAPPAGTVDRGTRRTPAVRSQPEQQRGTPAKQPERSRRPSPTDDRRGDPQRPEETRY